jgi:hypothetical protein
MTKSFSVFLCLALFINIRVSSQILISSSVADSVHPSAQLEVRSDIRGFLPPVMSTTARRAIQNPAEGLMVFDSSKQKMYVFTRAGWQSMNLTLDIQAISNGSALPNPGFGANELAGWTVEIYEDHAFLGAYAADIAGKTDQGAVYLFRFQNGTWNFSTQIIAPDGAAGDNFGNAIAANGDFVFIGASGDSFSETIQQGSVYIYKWVDTSLVYQGKITGSNATSGDRFGADLDANENYLVIGAPYDDIAANVNQGAVYFFEFDETNWVEKSKYFATTNVGPNNLLGKGIFIDSNRVVVGCDFINASPNYGFNRNRISVFRRSTEGVWALEAEIVNPTGQNFESFGCDVTLKDDILTVSAPFRDGVQNKDRGAVYVYKKNGASWNLIQTLAPVDSSVNDTFGDYFGVSTDRDGNYLIVGANYEDFGNGQIDYGGAFIFEWDGEKFVQLKKLRSTSPQVLEFFGQGVAIHKERILIGAPGRSLNKGGADFFYIE